jgi:hypothetical protein
MTVTIQIGNSDDKLTQSEWHTFVRFVRNVIDSEGIEVHFFGASANYDRWQNAAWVVNCNDSTAKRLKQTLAEIREQFEQDSIAWTEGETQLI